MLEVIGRFSGLWRRRCWAGRVIVGLGGAVNGLRKNHWAIVIGCEGFGHGFCAIADYGMSVGVSGPSVMHLDIVRIDVGFGVIVSFCRL